MSDDPALPTVLLTKLKEKCYAVEKLPPLKHGAEKLVYAAKRQSEDGEARPVAVLCSKGAAWNFKRELEVFKDVEGRGGHRNIIKMLDFFYPSEGAHAATLREACQDRGPVILSPGTPAPRACWPR